MFLWHLLHKYKFPTFLGAILSIILFLSFRLWFFSTSILTNGDWPFFFNETAVTLRINYFSIWFSDSSFGRVLIDVSQAPTYFLYGIFSKYFIFNYAINERVIHFLPAIVINIIGSYFLLNKLFKNKIATLIGVTIYLLNTYFLDLYTGDVTLAAAFAFFPLVFFFFINYLEYSSPARAIIFLLSTSVMAAYETRAFYVAALGMGLYFLIYIYINFRSAYSIFSNLKKIILLGSIFILINLYWLIGLLKVGSLTSNSILDRGLFGNQYFNIFYSLTLHHPWWSGTTLRAFYDQPIPLYFWLIPFFAALGLILNRSITTICFGVIALVGILLSKQVGPPFEGIYFWLYSHMPGFNAFREASKFYALIAIGYSVLISAFVDWMWQNWNQDKIKIFSKYALTAIIFSLFIWNTKPFISGEIGTLFISRQIPQDYLIWKNNSLSQPGYFRTEWIPKDSRWGIYTQLHSKVVAIDSAQTTWADLFSYIDNFALLPAQNQISDELTQPFSSSLFNISSIKYVVVPIQDIANDDDFFIDYGGREDPNIRQWYLNQLDALPWLKKINIGTKNLAVYENTTYKQPIFAFSSLYHLDSVNDLGNKYNFIASKLKGDFYFTTTPYPNFKIPEINISDTFENLLPQNINADNGTIIASTTADVSYSSSFYANEAAAPLYAQYIGNTLSFYKQAGSIFFASSTVNGRKFKVASASVPSTSQNYLAIGNGLFKLQNNSTFNIGSGNETTATILSAGPNSVPNGSFETGLWPAEATGCGSGAIGKASMSLDNMYITSGKQSLLLRTTSTACSSEAIVVRPGEYVLSLDYQSPNASKTNFHVTFNDAAQTFEDISLPIPNTSWQHYNKKLIVPSGATSMTLSLYAFSPDNQTAVVDRYDNISLQKLNIIKTVNVTTPVSYSPYLVSLPNGTSTLAYKNSNFNLTNLIANGSFEEGLWNTQVGDCNNYDKKGSVGMLLDTQTASDGTQSLELSATRHSACTSNIIAVRGGATYLVSFDYQSPNAHAASYYIGFNDVSQVSFGADIPVTDTAWHSFSRTIITPLDASSLNIVLYAKEGDGITKMVNRYDNVRLIEVPNFQGAYYLVNTPKMTLVQPAAVSFDLLSATKKVVHIKGATTPFYLAFSESYHPQWKLELNNEKLQGLLASWWPFAKPDTVADEYHYNLDTFLNGWYVDTTQLCGVEHLEGCTKNADGSYDIEMVIEFWPQRWFYVGLIVSSVTLLGCLGALVYSYRKKHA